MRTKKIIGMLMIILFLSISICTFSANTFAAEPSYILGITNVREATGGKRGAAYGIGGLKSDNTPTKKVWKIVSYADTTTEKMNFNNAFYCIKAEHGFVTNSSTRKCI